MKGGTYFFTVVMYNRMKILYVRDGMYHLEWGVG